MRRRWIFLFLLLPLTALLAFPAATSAGEGGPHWIIAPQFAPAGPVAPIPKTRYAYGWFGAQTRTQATHHHRGYHNRYVDWIIR